MCVPQSRLCNNATAVLFLQPYEEVVDLEQLQDRMVQSLGEYNARSRKPMDLVMFMFAVEHVSRLARYPCLCLFFLIPRE